MDIVELNRELQQIAEMINQLAGLDYHNEEYDKLEEELHTLEDTLVDKYGEYLEEAFKKVHEEYCPDTDVLLPIAYLAHRYVKEGDSFDVPVDEGIPVEAVKYPGKESRLVLVPSPTRIILQVDKDTRMEVWRSN